MNLYIYLKNKDYSATEVQLYEKPLDTERQAGTEHASQRRGHTLCSGFQVCFVEVCSYFQVALRKPPRSDLIQKAFLIHLYLLVSSVLRPLTQGLYSGECSVFFPSASKRGTMHS